MLAVAELLGVGEPEGLPVDEMLEDTDGLCDGSCDLDSVGEGVAAGEGLPEGDAVRSIDAEPDTLGEPVAEGVPLSEALPEPEGDAEVLTVGP